MGYIYFMTWGLGIAGILAGFIIQPRSQAPGAFAGGFLMLLIAGVWTYVDITNSKKRAKEAKEKKLNEQEKEVTEQKKLAFTTGLEKYHALDIKEEKEYHEGIAAMRQLGMLMQQSVYQEKEKDWAVLGGIADGIAGPLAGAVTAINAIQENERIKADNQARKEWGAKQNAFYNEMALNASLKAPCAMSTSMLKQKYAAVFSWSPLTLFNLLNIETKKIEPDSITNAVTVTVAWRAKDRTICIDGAIRSKIYTDKNECVGCAFIILPKTGTFAGKGIISGICIPRKVSETYTVKYEPVDLWELTSVDNLEYEREENLTMEEHKKIVDKIETDYEKEFSNILIEVDSEKESTQSKATKKHILKKKVLIGVASVLLISALSVILVIVNIIIPSHKYETASELMEQKKYEEARVVFKKIENYSDSKKKIEDCTHYIDGYKEAQKLYESKSYSEAESKFTDLDGYRDSQEKIVECKYFGALETMNNGEYEAAQDILESVKDYKDAAEKIEECHYYNGIRLFEDVNYEDALNEFEQAGTFKDAKQKLKECQSIIDKRINLANAEIGEEVSIGKYEQDNNSENGKEVITWTVLDKKDNKILLLSNYALEKVRFNEKENNITWEYCSLRKWLNSEFIEDAFDNIEKSYIQQTSLTSNTFHGKVKFSADTMDRVFVLDMEEVQSYLDVLKKHNVDYTDYVKNKFNQEYPEESEAYKDSNTWLRDTDNNLSVVTLSSDSEYFKREMVNSDKCCVRPAIWVEIDENYANKEESNDKKVKCDSCGKYVDHLITKQDAAGVTYSWCFDCWASYDSIIGIDY